MGNRITVTCHWLSEKAVATHSSTLAWKIPRVEKPGRLYSPWGRKESDTTERLHFHFSLFTFTHWRRTWQPTPVFLTGKSHGWRSFTKLSMGSQSPPGGRNSWYAVHKHVDSRQVRIRNLMMLTHNYLTANQSEEYPWADHILFGQLL